MKTLEQKKQEVEKLARQECKARGHHRWDRRYGIEESGGGDAYYVSGIGCLDGADEFTEPTWSHYVRTCIECGTEETTKDNRQWKYEDGSGRFECDPKSGHVHWFDGPSFEDEQLRSVLDLLNNYSDFLSEKDCTFLAGECLALEQITVRLKGYLISKGVTLEDHEYGATECIQPGEASQ